MERRPSDTSTGSTCRRFIPTDEDMKWYVEASARGIFYPPRGDAVSNKRYASRSTSLWGSALRARKSMRFQ